MIHEEICTYEVAKLAKEKGFNIHCTPFYALDNFTAEYVDDAGDFYEVHFEKGDLYLNYPIKGSLHKAKMLPAPTQSLLQRWLREEKGLHISIPLHKGEYKYFWAIDSLNRKKKADDIAYNLFATYELALEDALKYALENLV